MAISLLQPRYIKEADLLAKNARKLLHRKKDVLSDVTVADLSAEIDRLEAVAKARDELAIKESSEKLDKLFSRFAPQRADASWRENCEVLLVAFVIAIGIRAYFLQPFKIPTGSMQPTLNGIIGHPVKADQPLPGFLVQAFDSLWLGRTYVDAVAKEDEQVVNMQPVKRFGFLNYTRVECLSGRNYLIHAPLETLRHAANSDGFGVGPGRPYRKGEPIARGYVDTGDQVFVDKFSYHFRAPRRGDVFVFNTRGIRGIPMNDPEVKSQFYIKRLAATPGDKLRIDYPRLFINDAPASEFGFERVVARQSGYRGYSNDQRFTYLRTPEDDFIVPPKNYFALGDNSFNSSDSRAWGSVPAENVVGRGLFVYWPFSRHWGFIR
jgi:signal peptidase I